jgi:hypothetical protein
MGEQNVGALNQESLRDFTRALLDDVQALERMIEMGMIETDVQRIGAEQEFFLVDSFGKPAALSEAMLAELDPKSFTNELATFNIEANLTPARCSRWSTSSTSASNEPAPWRASTAATS